jgi:phenylpyruvate tautomerase PptA (4-oxalocrotonate tautomerase family)
MPVVTITLIEGYDEATREAMATRLTDAVLATIDAPPDGVTVIIHEVAAAGYMRGRQRRTPGPPPPAAAAQAVDYLRACEARDFEAAAAYLADGFQITVPGGATFAQPAELAAWGRDRYRKVTKTFERIDEAPGGDGLVVFCQGTLAGEWADGTTFEGIRFVDRFTTRHGLLIDQTIWNDMGEVLRAREAG